MRFIQNVGLFLVFTVPYAFWWVSHYKLPIIATVALVGTGYALGRLT